MRVVIVAAVFCALLVATQAKLHNPFEFNRQQRIMEGVEAIQQFHNHVVKGHKFEQQQQAATLDPYCNNADVQTVIGQTLGICGLQVLGILSTNATTTSAIDAAYDAFCAGECMQILNQFDANIIKCFASDIQGYFKFTKFICKKEGSRFCGANLRSVMVMGSCDNVKYDQTKCSALSTCTWNANEKECQTQLTNTQLDSICSPCLDTFSRDFGGPKGILGPDASMGVETLKLTLCSKVDGEWCYPQVQAVLNSDVDIGEWTTAQMDGMCSDKKVYMCLRKVVGGAMAAVKPSMDGMFLNCVNRTCNFQANCIETYCKPSYNQFIESQREVMPVLEALCLKNPRNGVYCFSKFDDQGCGDAVFGWPSGKCNSTCDATLKTMFDKLGCCVGTMQQLMFAPPPAFTSADYPVILGTITGTVGPTPAPYVSPYTQAPLSLAPAGAFTTVDGEAKVESPAAGGLEAFGVCPSLSDIKTRLSYQCVMAASTPIKKELKVKIVYSKVQADPKLKQAIIGSLIQDTSAAIGVNPSEIKNADLVEDTSVTVTTASTHMRALATESGSKFKFEIVTIDSAVAATAAAEFDSQASTGTLPLSSTSATVSKGCTSGCIAASGGLVAPSPSSAASITMMLAAVVAVLAALF